MKLIDLSGKWSVTIDDGKLYTASLPGTLDSNEIGYPDNYLNQWKIAESNDQEPESKETAKAGVITTRLTRKFTYEGPAVYSKEITLADTKSDSRIFLEVERTRDLSLSFNGTDIIPYSQGTISTPYVFELTDHVRDENLIELICDNSYPNWPYDQIKYSSAATDETQTNWNGILGYLRLRYESKVFISNIRVYSQSSFVTIEVDIDAALPYEGILCLKSSLFEKDIVRSITLEAGVHTVSFEHIPTGDHCKLWDEYEGNLYELKVSGDALESKSIVFGVRSFTKNISGRFELNGRTIFLRSEANCCVFPETGHMPLTVNEWLNILKVYKSYGVNCVRFHSHCPPDAAFTAADQLGILMQPELSHWNPNTAFEDEKSWHYYQLELKQILMTYANHPSFVMLTFGNELQAGETGHERMNLLLDIARSIDPTRMYANGSNVHYGAKGTDPCSDFYTSSNLYSMQIRATSSPMIGYMNECYPNAKTNYDKIMEELRKEYSGPVFSFEVGQYEVLPDFSELSSFHGVTVPDNLDHIKNEVYKKGFYSDWDQRVAATGELSRIAYREEIEAVLRTEGLSGISLLGLQDFPGQGTALVGMLNSHLAPKPYDFAKPENFRAFFRDMLPLVLLEKYTYSNSETLSAVIEMANYGKQELNAPTVYELSDGKNILHTGELPKAKMPCGGITVIGSISISLKNILIPQKLTLTVIIGQNKNEYPIWVYPDTEIDTWGEVVITRTYSETELELMKGKKVFYSPASDAEHFPNSVKSQFTTDFWSVGTFPDQSGSMGCLIEASHPLFSDFPTETHSNWQWWPMTNGRAFLLPDETRSIVTVIDSYARLRNLALLFECNVGNGRLIVSSMGLLENQKYPEVRALTKSIIRYMNSADFAPKQSMTMEELHRIIE